MKLGVILMIILTSNFFEQEVNGQIILPKTYLIADSIERNGDYVQAAPIFLKLLNAKLPDTLRGEVLMRYGFCQQGFGKFDSAIYFLQQSSDIWVKSNNKLRLYKSYLNIARIYNLTKNYSEADFFFNETLKLAQSSTDSLKVLIDQCILQITQEHYADAYFLIKKEILRYPSGILPHQNFYVFLGQGSYFFYIKNYDSAQIYLRNATLEDPPSDLFKANLYRNIAETYMEMGNYPKAFKYMDSTTFITDGDSSAQNLLLDYDTYRNLYERTGNYKKALEYAKKRQAISDTFYSTETNKALQDIKIKYETQKTLAKNANLEKDKAVTQRNLILAEKGNVVKQRNLVLTFIALGVVALLAFVAFRNTRIKQKANQLLTHQKQQVQELADQLAVANDTKARLFSTIGHDLRSPVSSLYASLKMQELKGNTAGGEMSEQTVRLLDTLEELLIWSKSQMDGFKIQPVKVNVQYFFEDLSAFYTTAAQAKNICVVNGTAKEVVIRADENLLKTIFRNAISNAIANTPGESTIRLTAIQTTDGKICMSVTNPCCQESFQKFKDSFDDAAVKSGAYGLGIVLMKEFAQKLGGEINLVYTDGHASLRLCV